MATPELLTRDQAAALLGVTARQLQRYASGDDPLVPAVPGGHGKPTLYAPETVGQWLIRRELAKLQKAAGHHDPIDFDRERARLVKAQADQVELKNAITRREVARVELLTFAAADAGQRIAAVLGTVKGRIKRAMPSLNNQALHEIEQLVVECQNAASQIQIDWSDAPEGDE